MPSLRGGGRRDAGGLSLTEGGRGERAVEWGWIFGALWSSCGHDGRIKLNLPQTVILRDGAPYKWLSTDDNGFLVRNQVRLHDSRRRRSGSRAPGKAASALIGQQIIDIVASFSDNDDAEISAGAINSNPICCAWYRDGRYENLKRDELTKLTQSERWRKQVGAIQDYIPVSSRRVGEFGRASSTIEKSDTAANIVARSIASHVERTYKYWNADADEDDSRTVSVVSFVADFIVDASNRLWFSHATRLVVRYTSRFGSLVPTSSTITAEIEANDAAQKLQSTLRLALNRKVSVQTCFSHFDSTDKAGYVGVEGLRFGLLRLGIGISQDAAKILLCRIGNHGANGLHFCSRDLADFATEPYDERMEDREEDSFAYTIVDIGAAASDEDGTDVPFELKLNMSRAVANEKKDIESIAAIHTDIDDDASLEENASAAHNNIDDDDASVDLPSVDGISDWGSSFPDSAEAETLEESKIDLVLANGPKSKDDSAKESVVVIDAVDRDFDSTDTSSNNEADATPLPLDRATAPDRDDNATSGIAADASNDSSYSSATSSCTCTTSADENAETDEAEETNGTDLNVVLDHFRQRYADEAESEKRRSEVHSMRQEDKLSLEVHRNVPLANAAWQEAAKRGREKARALRTMADEEEQRERELVSLRQKATKREEQDKAKAKANQAERKLEFEILKEKQSLLKIALEQSQGEEASALLRELVVDISECRHILEDVRLKQRKTQKSVTRCNAEARSAESTAKEMRTGLDAAQRKRTPVFALQELKIRCDRAEKGSCLANERLARTSKELSKYDSAVQIHRIALQQRSDLLQELQRWTKEGISKSKDNIARLRQQREDLDKEATQLKEKIVVNKERTSLIDAELERLRNKKQPGRYFDTSLWHSDGITQRMQTKDFTSFVNKERKSLESDISVYRFRLEEISDEVSCNRQLLSEASQLRASLTATHDQLCDAIQGKKTRKEALTVKEPTRSTFLAHFSPRTIAKDGVRLAARVRRKGHGQRSPEEKEWAIMDFYSNPRLYDERRRPELSKRESSSSLLSSLSKLGAQEVTEKVLNLPEQLQLALPFLKNQDEVRAHYLVNKYTLGRGELYFKSLDGGDDTIIDTADGVLNHHHGAAGSKEVTVEGSGSSAASVASATNIPIKSHITLSDASHQQIAKEILAIPAEEDDNNDNDRNSDSVQPTRDSPFVFATLKDLIQAHDIFNDTTTAKASSYFIISSDKSRSLHEISTQSIARGERQSHRFIVDNTSMCMLHTLTVTIVFQGVFSPTGYSPGRISASLARTSNRPTSIIGSSNAGFIPIGYAPHEEQAVNTTKSMGRIIIRHSYCAPTSAIESGLFEILIKAESHTRYSISVTGETCDRAQLVLQNSLASFLQERQIVKQYEEKASLLWEDMRLAERKLSIIDNLIDEADTELSKCKGEIRACDMVLAQQHETDAPDEDMDRVHGEIKVLEMEFAHWSHIRSGREQQRNDTRDGIEAMARSRQKVQSSAKDVKSSVGERRRELPLAAAPLFSKRAAAQVTEICDSHFDVEQVLSSSKVEPSSSAKTAAYDIALLCSTPGEKVRRLARREGELSGLTLEERRWCLLDRVVHPSKWGWLDNVNNVGSDGDEEEWTDVPILSEIVRIRETPFDQLRRKDDKDIKHLLMKYHDDKNRTAVASGGSAAANHGSLAAKTRAKSPHLYSKLDHEWQSIDMILNPDEWSWRFGGRKPSMTYSRRSERWKCTFTRDKILDIWKEAESNLSTDDERRVHTLLCRYNGSHQDYIDGLDRGDDTSRARGKWIYARASKQQELRVLTTHNDEDEAQPADVDSKCHLIQTELDRAIHCRDDFLVSSILNGTPQRYPTHILRLELERELDRLLIDQVFAIEQDGLEDSASTTGSAELQEPIADIIDQKCANDLTRREEAKRLGFGGCLACKSNPCRHKQYANVNVLQTKKDELSREIFFKQMGHTPGSAHLRRRDDSTEDLQRELKAIDNKLALSKVDTELHAACASMHNFVEVESLHGYKSHLATDDAIVALQREQDRLVAVSVANEVVDGILDWMHQGWYFGERETEKKLPPDHNTHQAAPAGLRTLVHEPINANVPCSDGPRAQISNIANEARMRYQREQCIKQQQERQEELNRTETTTKFGLFLLTFMWFRSQYQVRREKSKLSGENDIVKIGSTTRTPKIRDERERMVREEDAARARRERMQHATGRAKAGDASQMQRKQEEDAMRLKNLRCHYRKRNVENKSALHIQRMFRGHIARKAALLWRRRKAEIEATNALYNACSTAISRYWRGYKGREEAKALRQEMAEFLVAMRFHDLGEEKAEQKRRKRRTLFSRG